jgi:hypothetical protein
VVPHGKTPWHQASAEGLRRCLLALSAAVLAHASCGGAGLAIASTTESSAPTVGTAQGTPSPAAAKTPPLASVADSAPSPAPSPAPAPTPLSTPSPRAQAGFPLTISVNGRFLREANGKPFPILGRTAWFVLSLDKSSYLTFLDDTVAKGFTAIELHVLNHDERGNQPPYANNGELLPFAKRLDGTPWSGSLSEVPDFAAVNEPYWRFVDEFLTACEARKLAVLLFPAYTGFQGGSQGWMKEMTANGPDRMRSYGRFIADRYRSRPNLIWMLGGDYGSGADAFTSVQRDVEQALVDGMLSVPAQKSKQFAAEWGPESIGTDQPTFAAHLTLNGAYSFLGQTATQTRRAYADTSHGTRPSFLLEGPFDEEGPDGNSVNKRATQPTRRFIWRAWLNGIAGYVQGNGYIWPFRPGWQSHLNSRGQLQLAILNSFIKSIDWYTLVPDGFAQIGSLVTHGGGSIDRDDYVAVAATPNGSMLVAYLGPGKRGGVGIDMSKLRGPATARWFDPTSGTYIDIGTFPNTGARIFRPAQPNSAGDADWVLRLDA